MFTAKSPVNTLQRLVNSVQRR